MAIDRKKIIDDFSGIRLEGGETGLIECCNVLVQYLPTTFWNLFARRMVENMHPDLIEPTEFLLVNAAHECGYHTGHGVMTSDEWNAVVAPMVEKDPEDVLHGAFAVFAAWGWADAEITELMPGRRMVVRAAGYYESDTFGGAGRAPRPCAYMVRGISAALMDLAYGGEYDATGRTGLYSFRCAQTRGIECGDGYGEFVVTEA